MQRYQESCHALGSTAIITLVSDAPAANVAALFARLWADVLAFEARFSRFQAGSELTAFNNQAGREQTVSAPFRELLRTAKRFAEETGGLYNPFILPALQTAGYVGSWPDAANAQRGTDYRGRNVPAAAAIVIGKTTARIPKHSALDFGGIGKGFLLDELAALAGPHVTGFCLSLGGDILCGGCDRNGQAWRVDIQDASDAAKSVGTAEAANGRRLAIATSGVTKRGRPHADGTGAWHHIIDPRTNQPAETNVLTATVCAETGTAADVLAKCAVILGSRAGLAFAKAHGANAAVAQATNGAGQQTIQSFGKAVHV